MHHSRRKNKKQIENIFHITNDKVFIITSTPIYLVQKQIQSPKCDLAFILHSFSVEQYY